ncbi:MAG: aminotransferase class V-fold PLP-dependent enzyme [Opitutaceae bacterium]|nr:aminotransferase class V-fold PLP-dependent enzyme [Opitutaceae bacterium]
MDRKTFIRSLGLGALGAASGLSLNGQGADESLTLAPALLAYGAISDADFWRTVRAQYPLDPELHYMNTGGLGPAAKPVLRVFFDTVNAHQFKSDTGHDTFHGHRAIVAEYFGVDPSEICFTRNATEGNSIIAGGLALGEGDEVIFEDHAHPGGSGPWFNQRTRRGVASRLFTPSTESVEENLRRIRALITPRTKVIQISHITAPTGILLPAAEIAKLAREHGLWFHIDGAQTAGMFPFDLREIDCDSYATSGHKWLGAPHETGVLYIRKDRNDEVLPISAGSYTGPIPGTLPGNGTIGYMDDATRHEYATRSAASLAAVAAAVEFQNRIGRVRIAKHGRELALHLHHGLAKIPTVEVLTPTNPELRASITTFRTPKLAYTEIFDRLWKDHHFRCRPVSEQGLDAVRVSTHLFNTADEVEQLLAAVHTVVTSA